MELLDAGCIGRCVVLGEVTDIGTQLNGQHLLGEFSQYVEVMVERELGQWKYCFIARLLPGHFVVQVEDTEAEVLFQRSRQHLYVASVLFGQGALVEVGVVLDILYTGTEIGSPTRNVQFAFHTRAEFFVHVVIVPVVVVGVIMAHIEGRKRVAHITAGVEVHRIFP